MHQHGSNHTFPPPKTTHASHIGMFLQNGFKWHSVGLSIFGIKPSDRLRILLYETGLFANLFEGRLTVTHSLQLPQLPPLKGHFFLECLMNDT